MSRKVVPARLADAERRLEAAQRSLEREQSAPLPAGSSAPAAYGPYLRDLADINSYPKPATAPVYNRDVGEWGHEELAPPPFSGFGAVATTAEADCPPLEFFYARTLLVVKVRLRTAGTSTTTIKCYKNGSATEFATISLTSGNTTATSGAISEAFAVGDYMTVAVTAAGTGAKGWALYPRAVA